MYNTIQLNNLATAPTFKLFKHSSQKSFHFHSASSFKTVAGGPQFCADGERGGLGETREMWRSYKIGDELFHLEWSDLAALQTDTFAWRGRWQIFFRKSLPTLLFLVPWFPAPPGASTKIKSNFIESKRFSRIWFQNISNYEIQKF